MFRVNYKPDLFEFLYDEGVFDSDVSFLVYCSDGDVVELKPIQESGKFLVSLKGLSLPIKSIGLKSPFENEINSSVLTDLFPGNDKEYERSFIRKIKRIASPSVQFFTAFQLFNFFPGMLAYRCNAAVVMGYKAVEVNDKEFLGIARKSVLEALSFVSECEVEWHPKKNAEHLRFSLLCVAYHIAISQSDKPFLEEILKKITKEFRFVNNFFTPSYPIGLGLLLTVLVDVKLGDYVKADLAVKELEGLFKDAVRDSTIDRLFLFDELSVTHKTVVLAKKSSQVNADCRAAFNHAIRVKGDCLERLYNNFEAMYGN